MKKFGFTIIEVIMGIAFLSAILAGIFGAYVLVQRYFKDGVALAVSGANANISIEEIVRPVVREGRSFSITSSGNTLSVTRFDSSVNVFTFNNGDGSDSTFTDNTLEKNGSVIADNVAKIPGVDIFQELEPDERVGINFGIRNEGVSEHFREVRISTEIKLRN